MPNLDAMQSEMTLSMESSSEESHVRKGASSNSTTSACNANESSSPSPSTSSGVHSDLSYSSDESSSSQDSFTSSRSRRSQVSSSSSAIESVTASISSSKTSSLDHEEDGQAVKVAQILIPSVESPEDLVLDEEEDEGIALQERVKKHHHHHHTVKPQLKVGLDNYSFIQDGDFDIVWPNVIAFVIAHIAHFYSIYLLFADRDDKLTVTWIFSYWVGVVGGLGITAGAHRLWSHKSYDARLPLRIFLMVGQCIAGQNSLYVWCRDHRVHHKFSETDGDPHNTNRGFFFAHVGWLLRKKHPELKKKSAILYFDDLLEDPVVKFQRDYYPWLYLLLAVFIPAFVPVIVWEESFLRSLLIVYISRYITSLHSTWFVNSTAHMFGDRPYNVKIEPRENYWVSYGAFGEGYHNYHHTFPWDYSTSELGGKLNVTKRFIDLCAFLGLAYNLKEASKRVVDSNKVKVRKALLEKKIQTRTGSS